MKHFFSSDIVNLVAAGADGLSSGSQDLEPAKEGTSSDEPFPSNEKMESEEPLKRRFSRRSTGVKLSQVPAVVETSTLITSVKTADESVNDDSISDAQVTYFFDPIFLPLPNHFKMTSKSNYGSWNFGM